MIITFAGQKGGTGKTTLSFLVAETLASVGKKVAIRDDDPQKSFEEIVTDLQKTKKTKVELWQKDKEDSYDYVVVDTLPRLSSRVLKEAINEADRLVLPLIPSIIDVRATIPIIEMIKNEINDQAKAYIVWNKVKIGTRVASQLPTLQQSIKLKALNKQIPDRIAYSYSIFQGFGILTNLERSIIQDIVLELVS